MLMHLLKFFKTLSLGKNNLKMNYEGLKPLHHKIYYIWTYDIHIFLFIDWLKVHHVIKNKLFCRNNLKSRRKFFLKP